MSGFQYSREFLVNWGDADPSGIVYFPRMLEWFNDTEHEALSDIGSSIRHLIEIEKAGFVMGQISFRFLSPATYGDKIRSSVRVSKITRSTVEWACEAMNLETGRSVVQGTAIRIFVNLEAKGTLSSAPIPDGLAAKLQ